MKTIDEIQKKYWELAKEVDKSPEFPQPLIVALNEFPSNKWIKDMMIEYGQELLKESSTRIINCITDEEREKESGFTRCRDGLYIANGVIYELINEI